MSTEQKENTVLDYGFNFDDFSDLIVKDPVKEINVDPKLDESIETTEENKDTVEDSIPPIKEEASIIEDEKTIEEDEPQNEWGNLIKQGIDSGLFTFNPDKEYEESEEGYKELIQENIKIKQEEAVNEFKMSIGTEGAKILEYLSKGLSIENYIADKENYFDYDAMNVLSMSEDDKSTLIGFLLEKQGLDEDAIAVQIEAFKATNTLDTIAENARKSLKQLQDKEIADKEKLRLKQIEDDKIAKQQQQEMFKQSVLAIRDLQGIKLSETDASNLYDYITKPIGKNGETQHVIDDNEKSRLFYAYLKMKKFDFNKLEAKAERKIGLKFKKKIDESKTIGASSSTSTQVNNNIPNSIVNQQDLYNALDFITK